MSSVVPPNTADLRTDEKPAVFGNRGELGGGGGALVKLQHLYACAFQTGKITL